MYNHIFTLEFDDNTSITGLLIGQTVVAMLANSDNEVVDASSTQIPELLEAFEELETYDETLKKVTFYNMELIPEKLLNHLTALQK